MRKLVLILSAAAAVGFALPVISAQAEEGRVVIKTGERREHNRDWNRGHRKVVIINHREHDRGYHRGWREHRAEGAKVVIKTRHRDRDRD